MQIIALFYQAEKKFEHLVVQIMPIAACPIYRPTLRHTAEYKLNLVLLYESEYIEELTGLK